MEILLILSGFIFACLVALLYECKIRQMRKEPRNKVRFFVTKGHDTCPGGMVLWMNTPKWDNINGWISSSIYTHYLCNWNRFKEFYLNPNDFADMKEGEIREVFLNLEELNYE